MEACDWGEWSTTLIIGTVYRVTKNYNSEAMPEYVKLARGPEVRPFTPPPHYRALTRALTRLFLSAFYRSPPMKTRAELYLPRLSLKLSGIRYARWVCV